MCVTPVHQKGRYSMANHLREIIAVIDLQARFWGERANELVWIVTSQRKSDRFRVTDIRAVIVVLGHIHAVEEKVFEIYPILAVGMMLQVTACAPQPTRCSVPVEHFLPA